MQTPFAIFTMVLALTIGATPVVAQQQGQTAPLSQVQTAPLSQGSVISPILTIDSERVFLESAFGKRVAAEAEASLSTLGAQNRQIEADLEAEEKALTVKRASLSPEEFRELADAFDAKVQETRAAQVAKGRSINEGLDKEREVFLTAAAPVLEQLMRESGAAVILERRSVFVSASAVEITQEAIALLDKTLGSGAD